MADIPEFESVDDRDHRAQYDAAPAVVTTVVRHFESDVRTLLNHISHDYLPPPMVLVVRRLRLICGDDEDES